MSVDRERGVTQAFVSLARNLADGVDPVDLLSGLAEDATRLLNVASTGILLADPRHVLHVVAASSEAARALEVYQLQREQGPCLDCFRSGVPVSVPDLQAEAMRWPLFAGAAAEAEFASVHAVPLRLREWPCRRSGGAGIGLRPRRHWSSRVTSIGWSRRDTPGDGRCGRRRWTGSCGSDAPARSLKRARRAVG
jgi:GAF domain-containing protein